MFYAPLLLICNAVLVTHSWTQFEDFNEPSTPDDLPQFTSNRPHTTRVQSPSYKANVSKMVLNIHDVATASPRAVKSSTTRKRYVQRLRHKQNKFINMLWRRTNVFIDEIGTATKLKQGPASVNNPAFASIRPHNMLTAHQPLPQLTPDDDTDFYYFELTDSKTASNDVVQSLAHNRQIYENQLRPPIPSPKLSMQRRSLRQPSRDKLGNNKATTLPSSPTHLLINNIILMKNDDFSLRPRTNTYLHYLKTTKSTSAVTEAINKRDMVREVNVTTNISCRLKCKDYYNDDELCAKKNRGRTSGLYPHNTNWLPAHSTFYDKIKFFELYDYNTKLAGEVYLAPIHGTKFKQKIDMEHIEREIGSGHLNSRRVKLRNKRINQSGKNDYSEEFEGNTTDTYKIDHSEETEKFQSSEFTVTSPIATDSPSEHENITYHPIYQSATSSMFQKETPLLPETIFNESKSVSWEQYPFIAVYVHERYQVHCDAGVISPHWLLAAGSCLSRHHDEMAADKRSAFVTYCGDAWWDPYRINYVKYSVVHPQFSHKDEIRRHMYNIGVIKVVNSMATVCKNWVPVPLVSHQFQADKRGSKASAIGWGLDRYDTKYSIRNLPQRPLSVYKGLVFSETCPGSANYSRAKYRDEEGFRNVFCLTLPPYLYEETDPTHGALLLVDGKLVALYLQEERSPWGDQSAQYTGIWQLIPWIMKVAVEPYEPGFNIFSMDL